MLHGLEVPLLPVEFYEHLLRHVLGVLAVFERAEGHAVDHIYVLCRQGLKALVRKHGPLPS